MGQERRASRIADVPNSPPEPRPTRAQPCSDPEPLHVALLGIESGLEAGLRDLLARQHCTVDTPADAAELVRLAQGKCIGLALADTDAIDTAPQELTRDIKSAAPQTIVMLLVSGASIVPVVAAMRAGAYDVFLKPVAADELIGRVCQAIENKRLGQSITRRSRATEEAVRERTREVVEVKQYLANLVEAAGDAIITADLEGRITSWNRSAQEILGYPRDTVFGTALLDLASGRGARDQLASLVAAAHRGNTTSNAETVWLRNDRKEGTFSLTLSPITDSAQAVVGALIIARDITERKKLQDELFHAEKLASSGQLAAGVAHQINNPLGAISGRAQLLARSREPVDAGFLRTQIDKIQADCGRIAETVNDLLGFARKTETAKKHTDVNAVLDEAIGMVNHEAIARKVTVERRLAANLPLVLGSAHHLRQLFANLMTNAFDAMGPGGTLTITTTSRPPDDGQPQPVVEIAVADTGSGISPEDLEHIFEPFYTTKPPGEGTGLGLAVAKRIIEYHDGRIDVKSEPGVGTTFTIQLVVAR